MLFFMHKGSDLIEKQFIKKILYLIIACILALIGGVSQQSLSVNEHNWYDSIPPYNGTPYVEVNHDIPFFNEADKKRTDPFETYSGLDRLGRCGVAYANVCEDLLPTDERGDISSVKPSGWKQNKIRGEFTWQRCHLIGHQLTGENANKQNLITGTKKFNVSGMLPFENTVREYIDDNPSKHILYRVTPVFEEDDLVARGVLMEAWSVESNGYDVQFCVFVYNASDDFDIDYQDGSTKRK